MNSALSKPQPLDQLINPSDGFVDIVFDPFINGGSPTEGFRFLFFDPSLDTPQGGLNTAPYSTSSILYLSTNAAPVSPVGLRTQIAPLNAETAPQSWAGSLGVGQTTHGIGQVPSGPAVVVNVPEPGTVLGLLTIGGLGLGLKRKKTRTGMQN